eukprot:Clim_evm12s37 gene=Clim_evmTU12s37
MQLASLSLTTALLGATIAVVQADTPADCNYDDILGEWTFRVAKTGITAFQARDACASMTPSAFEAAYSRDQIEEELVTLLFPDIALNSKGERGHWTMIYNQGFEVEIGDKSYFALNDWKDGILGSKSLCNQTRSGWVITKSNPSSAVNFAQSIVSKDKPMIDTQQPAADWACFSATVKEHKRDIHANVVDSDVYIRGHKVVSAKIMANQEIQKLRTVDEEQIYVPDHDFVAKINAAQNSWQAVAYEEFENQPISSFTAFLTQGNVRNASKHGRVTDEQTAERGLMAMIKDFQWPWTPKKSKSEQDLHGDDNMDAAGAGLPKNFDWRDVDGTNYVSPVRDQGQCGSCYTFASMAMLESRVRIQSENRLTPVFSAQEAMDCNTFGQGCAGGYPFEVAGRYAHDFGIVEEHCAPYTATDGTCAWKDLSKEGRDAQAAYASPDCPRWRTDEFGYVGDFFGGSNEVLMMYELYHHGPITVGFEVHADLRLYSSGLYHHTGILPDAKANGNGLKALYDRPIFNPKETMNHAVTIVGYGIEKQTGERYWTVKNSWGEKWGDHGYFKIRRGTDECGIESLGFWANPVLLSA